MQKKNRFGTVYAKGAVTDWTCLKWFGKLYAGDFLLDDVPQSGRPHEVAGNQIKTLIENNQHYITQEIADMLKISKSSVKNHLYQLGYVNCIDVWVPHKWEEKPSWLHFCMQICNENFLFLKQIVMSDEK